MCSDLITKEIQLSDLLLGELKPGEIFLRDQMQELADRSSIILQHFSGIDLSALMHISREMINGP